MLTGSARLAGTLCLFQIHGVHVQRLVRSRVLTTPSHEV